MWAKEQGVGDDKVLFFSRKRGPDGWHRALQRGQAWLIVKEASERADVRILALRPSKHGPAGEAAPVHPHLFRPARAPDCPPDQESATGAATGRLDPTTATSASVTTRRGSSCSASLTEHTAGCRTGDALRQRSSPKAGAAAISHDPRPPQTGLVSSSAPASDRRRLRTHARTTHRRRARSCRLTGNAYRESIFGLARTACFRSR